MPRRNSLHADSTDYDSSSKVQLAGNVSNLKSDSESSLEKFDRIQRFKKSTKKIVIMENKNKNDTDNDLEENASFNLKNQIILQNNNNNQDSLMPKPASEPIVMIGQKTDHVMISYNKESRPLCIQIKAGLEKYGHKIWIDVEDIYGNSLESMANAVENSKCVLVCKRDI